ncbi:pilus assembly protein PilP [Desulfuromonas thiophila]|jgi:type IV pilus assembly protein PilP|uniref:Type IV pilus assembly protein PilP n=1 Tax=Desulfuromonas thiophila TaxID=57664 RepID=A0A1G7AVI0_9BACT|nr:pilus assembly protein PilP [Desulfuromonas thiophila]MDY0397637.1 pilus assembly protein PilP [Desulfuromonas thiophila]SDE17956.1 type IV pilus assembly protein PilP [Desulfuromonas thiophila]
MTARLILLFIVLLVLLTACQDAPPQPARPVQTRTRAVAQKPPARPEPQMEKTPETQPPEFSYQARDRRDPFVSLLTIREPEEDSDEPLTPLQNFGLKELRLIAVILGKGEARAMVLAPDKKAYTLTKGVKVGRNKGEVTAIQDEEVIIEERFRDFSGATRTEVKRITLPQREGV